MRRLTRAKWMLTLVAVGLFLSGVTVWPAVSELKAAVHWIWGQEAANGGLHGFILRAIEGLEETKARYPFMLYAHDWLAFAHIMLAILFAGAIRDPMWFDYVCSGARACRHLHSASTASWLVVLV